MYVRRLNAAVNGVCECSFSPPPCAEELIDRMADNDVEPDKFTYDAVKKRRSIRSYARKMLLL